MQPLRGQAIADNDIRANYADIFGCDRELSGLLGENPRTGTSCVVTSAGWAVGLIGGTYLSWADGLKPLHLVAFGHISFTAYVGLIALIANIVTAVVVNGVLIQIRRPSHAFRGAP